MEEGAAGRRQRTEDRGQTTEDRRQRTDDRGQTTEDRGQRTEDRGQKKVKGNTVEEKIGLPFTVYCSPDALRFDKYNLTR